MVVADMRLAKFVLISRHMKILFYSQESLYPFIVIVLSYKYKNKQTCFPIGQPMNVRCMQTLIFWKSPSYEENYIRIRILVTLHELFQHSTRDDSAQIWFSLDSAFDIYVCFLDTPETRNLRYARRQFQPIVHVLYAKGVHICICT